MSSVQKAATYTASQHIRRNETYGRFWATILHKEANNTRVCLGIGDSNGLGNTWLHIPLISVSKVPLLILMLLGAIYLATDSASSSPRWSPQAFKKLLYHTLFKHRKPQEMTFMCLSNSRSRERRRSRDVRVLRLLASASKNRCYVFCCIGVLWKINSIGYNCYLYQKERQLLHVLFCAARSRYIISRLLLQPLLPLPNLLLPKEEFSQIILFEVYKMYLDPQTCLWCSFYLKTQRWQSHVCVSLLCSNPTRRTRCLWCSFLSKI